MSSRKRLAAWAGPVHPGHAVVLSIDEKSQIQAFECTKRSKCASMIRDYKRNGTTTLFAVLSVLEGKVIGGCGLRYRQQKLIGFLATFERSVPVGKVVHAILDNYATHKHRKCWPGSATILGGALTSPLPRGPESTLLRASCSR